MMTNARVAFGHLPGANHSNPAAAARDPGPSESFAQVLSQNQEPKARTPETVKAPPRAVEHADAQPAQAVAARPVAPAQAPARPEEASADAAPEAPDARPPRAAKPVAPGKARSGASGTRAPAAAKATGPDANAAPVSPDAPPAHPAARTDAAIVAGLVPFWPVDTVLAAQGPEDPVAGAAADLAPETAAARGDVATEPDPTAAAAAGTHPQGGLPIEAAGALAARFAEPRPVERRDSRATAGVDLAAPALGPQWGAGASTGLPAASVVHLATPAASPDFARALGVQVAILAQDGVQQARLELNPAEMGPVSVQIVIEGNQARVDFGADAPATRSAIESGLPELASALREAGLTLTGGGVSQHSRGRGQDEKSAHGPRGAGRAERADHDEAPAIRPRRVAAGGVDLYA